MDLMASKKTPAFAALSSPEEWLAFLTDALSRILQPVG